MPRVTPDKARDKRRQFTVYGDENIAWITAEIEKLYFKEKDTSKKKFLAGLLNKLA